VGSTPMRLCGAPSARSCQGRLSFSSEPATFPSNLLSFVCQRPAGAERSARQAPKGRAIPPCGTRPTAWVRESVFSDTSPERAEQPCGRRAGCRLYTDLFPARGPGKVSCAVE
jgi:hypothetical protein